MGPRFVDLFTGVGGAYRGYVEAGMTPVVAVDIAPQPDHPDPSKFLRADAIQFLRDWVRDPSSIQADFVHASMPCQAECTLTKGTNQRFADRYVNLYRETKELLETLRIPYAFENPEARPDVVLCGEMFGLHVIRHRNFELAGWRAPKPKHIPHRGRVKGYRHGINYPGHYYAVYGEGGGKGSIREWQDAMNIHWTVNRKSIAEAIPPAYTKWVGEQFIAHYKRSI